MLLYDVGYPHSQAFDSKVSFGYLRKLAADKKNNGAVATCVNGPADTLILRNGEWVDAKAGDPELANRIC